MLKFYTLVFVVGVLGIASCDSLKETKVYVECQGTALGFNCTAEHKQGSKRAKACWTAEVICQNGTVVRGNGCLTVGKDEKSSILIPNDKIENLAACDAVKTTAVKDLVLTIAD
jgi:hypothetical protein